MSTFSQQISVSGNDAEEEISDGYTSIESSDLEMLHDSGTTEQAIGLRFTGVTIPKNSTINSASIDFVVDVAHSGSVSVDIHGSDEDSSSIFTEEAGGYQVTSLTQTTAGVTWAVGGSGSAENTVVTTDDISDIISEIISRTNWASGNNLTIIFDNPTSSNYREFESYDGEAGDAPTLDVDYTPNAAPSVALNSPADTATGQSTTPTLQFTGTDSDGDDIRYNVQVATDSDFSTGDITKGTVASNQVSGGDPTASVSITDENAIVAIVTTQDSNTNNLGAASVVRDGQSFTKLAEYGGSGGSGLPVNLQIWYLANPNTGTANVVADCNGSINNCAVVAYPLAGCNTSDLINGYNGASTSGSSPSVSVTTDEDSCYLIGALVNENTISGVGAGQDTDAALTDQSFENTTATSKLGGAAGSQSLSFTSTSSNYAIGMVAINKAAGGGSIIIDAVSGTDPGFANVDTPADTDPFNSGDQADYDVQSGDELNTSTTYYWRVRGIDPNGGNGYGSWATTRSFTTGTGGTAVTSDRSAKITGKAAATSDRAAKVTGKDTASSDRNAKVAGQISATSDRAAKITGKVTTSSDRAARIVGKLTTSSDRNASITGQAATSSDRSAKISGKSVASSDRSAKITGKDTASSDRSAKITGQTTASSDRAAKISGKQSTNSDRSAKVTGQDTASSDRAGKVSGVTGASSNRSAKITGKSTSSSDRSAKVIGSLTTSSDRAAKISGIAPANSDRSAKIVGKDTSSSDRNAKISGKDTSSSDRSASISGVDTDYSDRSAKVVGKQSANSDRNAKVFGVSEANSDRSAKIVGILRVRSDRNAKIVGKEEVQSDRSAKISGIATITSDRLAKVVGKLTASSTRRAKLIGTGPWQEENPIDWKEKNPPDWKADYVIDWKSKNSAGWYNENKNRWKVKY